MVREEAPVARGYLTMMFNHDVTCTVRMTADYQRLYAMEKGNVFVGDNGCDTKM